MSAVVFAGPSLGPAVAPDGVALRGPAMAGDLYRAARDGATVIGLVDGVFEDRPTVWHKEILWALDRGVRVLGAASLGALRAAECEAWGMAGVGAVFAQVRDGTIEDDSDLAVMHAPEALGWQPLTEARVNVRATVDAAVAAGHLAPRAARRLRARAEATPFRGLTWPALCDGAVPAWLPAARVDLKRADAQALLAAVAEGGGAGSGAPPARSGMADTRYWQGAVAWFEQRGASPEEEAVLDELRLEPARYERALVAAFARRAATTAPGDAAPDAAALADDLRQGLGLGTARDYHGWLARQGTSAAAVATALADEERLALALERASAALAPSVLDALRIDGRFEPLARRAADKAARLAGRPEPTFGEGELAGLIAAFCARQRVSIDGDADLAARALGLEDRRGLHRLLAAERDYLQALDGGDAG